MRPGGRNTVVDRNSFRDASQGTASNGIPQAVTIHNSLKSVDTFAIVHTLRDRVDGCARPTRFATSVTLCSAQRSPRNFHSIVSLYSHFEIYNSQ